MAYRYPTDQVVWSTKDYNVCQFLAKYGNTLPQLVKVVQGYHGDYHDIASLGNDEILRIHAASTQVRILGSDAHGETLSVPVEFGVRLQIVHDNMHPPTAWPPTTLIKLLEQFGLPMKVRFPQTYPTWHPDEEDLGAIQLDSQFEQRHLFVNCVLLGKLDARVRILPCQLDQVRFVVAKGFENKNKEEWKLFMKDLTDDAADLDYDGFAGASDIAMYAPNAVASVRSIYSNLIPQRFVKIRRETQRASNTRAPSERQTTKEIQYELSQFSKRVKSGVRSVAKSVLHGMQTHVPSPVSVGNNAWGRLKRAASMDSKLDDIGEDEGKEGYGSEVSLDLSRDDSHKYESMQQNDENYEADDYLLPLFLESETTKSLQQPVYQNSRPKAPPPVKPKPTLSKPQDFKRPETVETHGKAVPPALNVRPRPVTAPRPDPRTKPDTKRIVHVVLPIPTQTDGKSDEVSDFHINLGICFVALRDVPRDISNISVDGVSQCLRLLGLTESVVQTCASKRLDGKFFDMVNEEKLRKILENDMKISNLDTERVVLFSKYGWRQS